MKKVTTGLNGRQAVRTLLLANGTPTGTARTVIEIYSNEILHEICFFSTTSENK